MPRSLSCDGALAAAIVRESTGAHMQCHLPRFASNSVAFLVVGIFLAVSLVACRGSQDFLGAGAFQLNGLERSAGPAQATAQRNSIGDLGALGGGPFNGGYTGQFSLVTCVTGLHGRKGTFTFSGLGKASFLRKSTEQGQLTEGVINNNICVGWGGNATLTSVRNPANTIYVQLNDRNFVQSLCGQAVSFSVIWGTGKFARAAGNGTVTFQCSGSSGQYIDQWSGTITF